jgi:putative cardiolipin synthase
MHGKMLIADGQLCLVGGRNIDNEYFRMDSLNNFLDREVLIRGDAAVAEARKHFNTMWNHKVICTDLKGDFPPDDRQRCHTLLETSAVDVARQLPLLRQLRIPDTISTADAIRPTVNPVHFIYPEFTYRKNGRISRPSRSDRRVTRELLKLVAAADSTLDIEAAYFLPTHIWFKALRAAHRRGVRIRVITNSSVSNDVPLLQAIYCNRRNRYKRAGIELYEYCGSRMVHLKTLTIDRHIALIGSYNLERKSEKFNTEVAAWVDDPFLAGKQEGLFEKYLRNCKPFKGEYPATTPAFSDEQKKRKRKVAWMRCTLAPIVGLGL